MKTLAFCFCVLTSGSLAFSFESANTFRQVKDPTLRPYPLKDVPIDSEKFAKVFALVSEQVQAERKLPLRYYEILQTAAPGKFLAMPTSGSGSTQTVLLDLPGAVHADGDHVSIRPLPTGELHRYTTVLGANATVPIIRDGTGQEPEFTPIEFREKLIAGHTWEVSVPMPESVCKDCNGFGKVPVRSGNRSGNAKEKCELCNGYGKIQIIRKLLITWG